VRTRMYVTEISGWANLAPYERYSLKIYTGHSVENRIPGFISPNHGRVQRPA